MSSFENCFKKIYTLIEKYNFILNYLLPRNIKSFFRIYWTAFQNLELKSKGKRPIVTREFLWKVAIFLNYYHFFLKNLTASQHFHQERWQLLTSENRWLWVKSSYRIVKRIDRYWGCQSYDPTPRGQVWGLRLDWLH